MLLQIIRQDITQMNVDAIVNTTNAEMVGYSGVDFTTHYGVDTLYGLDAIPEKWLNTLKKRDYIEEMCETAGKNWIKPIEQS